MRTALGMTAVALALGTAAVPAQAGCVDDYLRSGKYVAPRPGTVTRHPDGSVTIQPNAAGSDAAAVAAFAQRVAGNETARLLVLVDCVK